MDQFEKQHIANLKAVDVNVKKSYFNVVDEIVRKLPANKTASWVLENKALNTLIETRLKKLSASVTDITEKAIIQEWELSGSKYYDEMLQYTKSKKVLEKIIGQQTNFNQQALQAFLKRKNSGINLSEKIWKYTGSFQKDLKMHLGMGIANGDSADKIAMRLKKFLNNSEYFFTEQQEYAIRQENPEFWKEYQKVKTGAGVYRNGFKNAKRLARNETNISYRSSDYERWKRTDFITGVDVHLSGQHPLPDICDQAEGRYPKTFKFTGWHTNCLCYATPVKLGEKDFDKHIEGILAGRPTIPKSKYVKDLPSGFKTYLSNNADKIRSMKSTPYFIKDNFVNGDMRRPKF